MLEYDDVTHEYKFKGAVIPSVTQVIPRPDFHMSEDRLKEKAEAGKERHSLIKMYHDTKDTFGDPLLIMLDEWEKENEYLTGKLIAYEVNLFSEKHKFAGRPDAIFEKAVVDFKSSWYGHHYNALQLSGYALLAAENNYKGKKKRIVIYPGKKKMLMKNVDDEQADGIFLMLVKKWHMEQEIKKYYER